MNIFKWFLGLFKKEKHVKFEYKATSDSSLPLGLSLDGNALKGAPKVAGKYSGISITATNKDLKK